MHRRVDKDSAEDLQAHMESCELAVDAAGVVLEVNQAALSLFGCSSKQRIVSLPFQPLVSRRSLDLWQGFFHRVMAGSDRSVEYLPALGVLGKDGSAVVCSGWGRQMSAASVQPVLLLVLIPALGQQVQELEQLRTYSRLFTEMREGVMVTSVQGEILEVNPAFTDVTGYLSDEVKGRNPRLLQSGRHDRAFYEALWQSLSQRGYWEGEIWNRRKSGDVYAEWLSITALHDAMGQVDRYLAVFSDISLRKQAEHQIRQLAYFDSLTSLANRTQFMERLSQALVSAEGRRFALMYVDLDAFKRINDLFGYEAGDEVLKIASQRMLLHLRDGDVLARLGGDEFAALVCASATAQEYERVAERILVALTQPYQLDGKLELVGASIGLVVFPDDVTSAEDMLRMADAAMYAAKGDGKGRVVRWQRDMSSRLERRRRLELALRDALNADDPALFVVFQPQVCADDGRLVSLEALLCWRVGDELVMPGEFVPIAESVGLAVVLGERVLHRVLVQLADWQRQGVPLVPVAVNVSAHEVQSRGLVERWQRALAQHGVDGRHVRLELTESVAMQHFDLARSMVDALAAVGVLVDLDDFGTGFSSLAYLKFLRVHALKVDRSFVQNLSESQVDRRLVEAILAMAHALEMQVIAEGVETHEQLALLQADRCDLIQGFLTGRPLPAEQVVDWLKAERKPVAG